MIIRRHEGSTAAAAVTADQQHASISTLYMTLSLHLRVVWYIQAKATLCTQQLQLTSDN
jgi:hypothetical protein